MKLAWAWRTSVRARIVQQTLVISWSAYLSLVSDVAMQSMSGSSGCTLMVVAGFEKFLVGP